MASAHNVHGIQKVPPPETVELLIHQFLEDSKMDLKYAVEVLWSPDFKSVPKGTMSLKLDDFVDKLQTDPKLERLRHRLTEYASTIDQFIRSECRADSVQYLKSFDSIKEKEARNLLSLTMLRNLIEKISIKLEAQFPELRQRAYRFGQFHFSTPHTQAFFIALALSGDRSLEAAYPDADFD